MMQLPSEQMNASSDRRDPSGGRPIFADFAPPIRPQTALRRAITSAYRRPETDCLPPLLAAATLSTDTAAAVRLTARKLVNGLRAKHRGLGVQALIQEYALSSQEGVALMCLAEALLRIPDTETRDALIRDKIAKGNWAAHIGNDRSLFVNASTWGLMLAGKLTAAANEDGLASALTCLLARAGEPVIRQGVEFVMRMMGEQFVVGETIDEALRRARRMEAKGFCYSYDMLGEGAMTAADAERYYADYETAIHAVGKSSSGRGIFLGAGISIKLSALHPRYSRAQAERVMRELLPKVKTLAALAKRYDIGFNIDAEEADRLEISLDILESLCLDPDLADWNGLGFVVQAYGKRCPEVLDYIIDLARRSGHRIMTRLVKGAYWDTEIKRAQLDGLEDFPVFTRKVHTDVSYIACARKLLSATDAVFPQFATHNAQTLATLYHMAGADFEIGRYEFQCLQGMGESLYEAIVGKDKLDRPCRIYAPVGPHHRLLAYLVRRLLENGANSSFVSRIADSDVSIEELIRDPVETFHASATPGSPHPQIANPHELFGVERANSCGLDLSNETTLASLHASLRANAKIHWKAAPRLADMPAEDSRPVLNPADHADIVGTVIAASEEDVRHATAVAATAAGSWSAVPPAIRARCLLSAADRMQERMPLLLGLMVREAGKSLPNAIAEVREAIDFLRYYAQQASRILGTSQAALGPIACISPWNFPLAIFTGQIAAALVAGNPVLAKPAEETPLVATEAVRILHESGIPHEILQLLPGDGRIGKALVASGTIAGVMFTGSSEVARSIQEQLAERAPPNGRPIPLIAETGGQNAMIVDSSALPEQVIADVLMSAFDSAGQRCSALRVLCLQEDIADSLLVLLKDALRELDIGNPDRLAVDIGPVISAEAKSTIEQHVETMRDAGFAVKRTPLPEATADGTFCAPTIIEIRRIADLKREVFGPVLHVLRYRRDDLDQLIDDINATGYGLTFGLHSRLEDTVTHVTSRISAGNIYVNRNTIGAVVGVQPFGGLGLSGTGPKAGGPLYLSRLIRGAPIRAVESSANSDPALVAFADWLEDGGLATEARTARALGTASPLGLEIDLPGPVGERNLYALHPRGKILLLPETSAGLYQQMACTLATGNDAVIGSSPDLSARLDGLPASVARRISFSGEWSLHGAYAGALIEGDARRVQAMQRAIAALPGPLVVVQAAASSEMRDNPAAYNLCWLLREVSISINTAAAGGNANLMAMG
jgi:RHH-type transcriptional regulator, proline utilization regulon repressor / proline dehydrogenase / delta 1-pyrroline-5-carboxylate dehydrogenase